MDKRQILPVLRLADITGEPPPDRDAPGAWPSPRSGHAVAGRPLPDAPHDSARLFASGRGTG